uniref:THAP domain-containing protein 9 n=1 Tax=Sipha flava TaxID=143950 RepID=A0A2S2Q0B7_9HEMI
MLVCLNGKWKWPIGYFLQAKSTASIQAGLVTTTITMAHSIGLRIWSVTCDGTSTNISTMSLLGCKISSCYSEIVEYFLIPEIDQKIRYVPDSCHNLKLARNALGTYKKFKYNGNVIDWSFLQNLHMG